MQLYSPFFFIIFSVFLSSSQPSVAMDTPPEEGSPRSPSVHRLPLNTSCNNSPLPGEKDDLTLFASFLIRFGDFVTFTDETEKLEVYTLAFSFAKRFKSFSSTSLTSGNNIHFLINRIKDLKDNRYKVCVGAKVLVTDTMTEWNIINIISAVGELQGDYVNKCRAVKNLVTPRIAPDDICILLTDIDSWGPKYATISEVAQPNISPDMGLYDVKQVIQQVISRGEILL